MRKFLYSCSLPLPVGPRMQRVTNGNSCPRWGRRRLGSCGRHRREGIARACGQAARDKGQRGDRMDDSRRCTVCHVVILHPKPMDDGPSRECPQEAWSGSWCAHTSWIADHQQACIGSFSAELLNVSNVWIGPESSTDQCNTACSLSAGVWKP